MLNGVGNKKEKGFIWDKILLNFARNVEFIPDCEPLKARI